jgi:hypothetical protein
MVKPVIKEVRADSIYKTLFNILAIDAVLKSKFSFDRWTDNQIVHLLTFILYIQF